jgi:uncharacterized membrane protein YgaE (UPF0421/DUF939 family)
MSIRNKILVVYIGKCAAGALICYFISQHFGKWIDYPWNLLSVILVLSPEGKDAVELSLTRIKANLVGALVGIAVLLSQIHTPWNLALGIAFSLFVCDRLKLNAGARSTLAAMIIILLHPEGSHPWDSAISRVSAVIVGCAVGLSITYAFHSLIRLDVPSLNSEGPKKEKDS